MKKKINVNLQGKKINVNLYENKNQFHIGDNWVTNICLVTFVQNNVSVIYYNF